MSLDIQGVEPITEIVPPVLDFFGFRMVGQFWNVRILKFLDGFRTCGELRNLEFVNVAERLASEPII